MVDSEIIAGLGTRASYVRAAPNALEKAAGEEEQALLACIGAGAQLRDVFAGCGLPESKAIALLLGLRLKGLVLPMAGAPAPAASAAPPSMPTPALGLRLDPAALAEKVELEDARKREVLKLEARLATDDYFALLGVPVRAPAVECKKAYYELTKRFHPDRFFGKNLGSYKDRIDRVFKKLTEAQAVLTDPNKRAVYLAQHQELVPSTAPVGRQPTPMEARRVAERRARLARHPYLAKQGRMIDLVTSGKENLEAGDFGKASTDLSHAAQLEPKNREVLELLSRAKKGADKQRAENEFKDAVALEKAGDLAAAVSRAKTAVTLDPDNADYSHRAARLILGQGAGADLKEAGRLARRASELAPRNVEYHLTFARILSRAGLEKNAAREYEAVLKLDPQNETAKEQMKKLRWKL